MALIENGVVANMLWCSASEPETDALINPADRPVGIGDTYSNGKFYRDGVEILTPLEEAQKKIAEYEAALPCDVISQESRLCVLRLAHLLTVIFSCEISTRTSILHLGQYSGKL